MTPASALASMPVVAVARRGAHRSIVLSAVRGAGLIGLAVIVGIVLLQVVDDGSSGPSNGGGGGGGVTPTDATGETTPTTGNGRPKAEVRVLVLNAGQPAGSALNVTNQLKLVGYTTLSPSNDPVARQGVAVQCKEGFEAEAATLATDVGQSATTEPFPAQPPAGAGDADCIVLLGQV
jgi:LytR cell envelope-related transcriptional attenuator